MDINAVLKGVTGVRPDKSTRDGAEKAIRLMRDGSVVTMPWIQALCAEGRVYAAHFGTATTAVAFGTTAYDADRPDLVVDVPDSVIAIPLFFETHVVATGAVIFRTHFMVSPVKVLDTTAAAYTAITPLNLRLGNPRTPSCTAAHTLTANGGDPTTGAIWLMNEGDQADLDAAVGGKLTYQWSAANASFIPLVEDGGSMNAYTFNGTSGTGFMTLVWAELDKEEFRL